MRIAILALGLPLMAGLVSPAWAAVDTSTLSQRIELAGYHRDAKGMEAVRAELEDATSQSPQDKYLYYYLGYVDYVLAEQYSDDGGSEATDRVQAAEGTLNRALKLDPGFAEAEALLGSSYGLEIGLHPIKGMFLGSKASKHLAHALQLAPDDPRMILLNAISDYETPPAFGGDKQRAAQGFRHAVNAFDSYHSDAAAAPSWGRAEAYELLGLAESEAGQHDLARADYAKALALVPDYRQVQKNLAALPPSATTAGSARGSL